MPKTDLEFGSVYLASPTKEKAAKIALTIGNPDHILPLKTEPDTINNDPQNRCRFNVDGEVLD